MKSINTMIDWMSKLIYKDTRIIFLIIWISGISYSIGIIESSYFKIEGYANSFTNWYSFWICVLFFGIIVGGIGYYIKGLILYIGVRISGGEISYRSASRALVYSGLPIYVIVILTEIINMLIYSKSYFIFNTSIILDVTWIIARTFSTLVFFIIIVMISNYTFKAKRISSILILCVVPVIYNLLIFLTNDKYTNDWTKLYKLIPLYF